jgi:hypothetical protein
MENFCYIADSLIKTKNIKNYENKCNYLLFKKPKDYFVFYWNTFNNIDKYDIDSFIILDIIYQVMIKSNNNKFKVLNDILNNIFMDEIFKEKYLNIFFDVQKKYHVLNKFVYICKMKKAKVKVDYDLLLNPISEKDKDTICIIQNKFKYIFAIRDLVNIIETALSNAPGFFLHILSPKNPFNKIPFSNTNMYNIYFKVKQSNFTMPILFHLFFLTHFDKAKFSLEYEAIIRDYAIKKFVFKSNANILRKEIIIMLYDNIYTKKLSIDKDFPDNILVEIMKPFLYYYYTYKYGVAGTEKYFLFKNVLYFKLKVFYSYNVNFGRKYYSIINNKKVLKFNTKHLSFDQIQTNSIHLYNINTELDNDNSDINSSTPNTSSSSSRSNSSSSPTQTDAVENYAEVNDAEANDAEAIESQSSTSTTNSNENELEWEQLNNLLYSANLNNNSDSDIDSF